MKKVKIEKSKNLKIKSNINITNTIMEDLPNEILYKIFNYCDIKDLSKLLNKYLFVIQTYIKNKKLINYYELMLKIHQQFNLYYPIISDYRIDIKRLSTVNLKEFYLSYNNLGSFGLKDVILPDSLKILYLNNNYLGSAGLKYVKLPNSLKELYLYNTNLGSAGLKDVILPNSLKIIILDDNKLGSDGLKGVILPNSLKELYLSNNNLGSAGLKDVIFPNSLKILSLNNNNLSSADQNKLSNKLPNCKIYF